jgi:twitching motility protein PilT
LPHLDSLLRALADQNARELVFVENSRPLMRFDDGARPLATSALTRAQILALIAELAPQADVPRLGVEPVVRFAYSLAGGPAFACETVQAEGRLSARICANGDRKSEDPTPPSKALALPSPRAGAPAVEGYLLHTVECGASDLHLSSGEPPMLRVHGEMVRLPEAAARSPEEVARLVFAVMAPRYKKEFEETGDTDFAYEIPGAARFRCNVFMDRKGVGAVFRVIPCKIPSAEDLGLSKTITDLAFLSKGLVLVTGPAGSGKSTTLAALVDFINRNRTSHIITIEDPIEFVHNSRKCLVNQREVDTHTESFQKALRAALREDPDIVLVGQMRDLETVAIAIETAETGHLVFGTLHTSTAASTVDRIIDQFPADRRPQIRVMLSESLKGVVSQVLVKRKGGGRVAAMEVLIGVPAILNLIREGKTFQIPALMQTGREHGMVLMDDALIDLVRRGLVDAEEALLKAADRTGFASLLKSAGIEIPAGP